MSALMHKENLNIFYILYYLLCIMLSDHFLSQNAFSTHRGSINFYQELVTPLNTFSSNENHKLFFRLTKPSIPLLLYI